MYEVESSGNHIQAKCSVSGSYKIIEKDTCEHEETFMSHLVSRAASEGKESSSDGMMFLALPLTLCATMVVMGINSLATYDEPLDFSQVDTKFCRQTYKTVRTTATLMGKPIYAFRASFD